MPKVWFRNVHKTLIHTQEQFEYWMFDLDFVLEYFINSFDEEIRSKLDYSPESLNVLEGIILERYSCVDEMMNRYEMLWVEDAARYVGEVFRKELKGKWEVDFNPKYAFFELPEISAKHAGSYKIVPRSLVTASSSRRRGDYVYTVLMNAKKSVFREDDSIS